MTTFVSKKGTCHAYNFYDMHQILLFCNEHYDSVVFNSFFRLVYLK